MLTLVLLAVFFACVAALYLEGMWGNAIRLINVVTATLLAVNFFEPAAAWLAGWKPSYTYLWDFLILWGLFALFVSLLRAVTDLLSRVKVRFLKIVDRIGSGVFAVCVGWVMVCFTAMSLHVAPLGEDFFRASFQPDSPAERNFFGLGPDRMWLAFVQKCSRGLYCRTLSSEELARRRYGLAKDEPEGQRKLAVFDRHSDFIYKYRQRRVNLEAHIRSTGRLRVRDENFEEHY